MSDPLTPSAPLTHPPNSVISARVLLFLFCLGGILGVVGSARRFLGGENPSGDLLALNWSVGLAVASGFAFWAIGRRRPIGRWIAVALFGLMIARSLAALSSRSDASGALASQAIFIAVLGLQTYLLARGTLANRYFEPSNAARPST